MGSPFNSDIALLASVDALIEAFNVRTIVETGTHKGFTAKWFAGRRPTHSIEIDRESHAEAAKNTRDQKHLTLHLGSSPEVIRSILPEIAGPALFYLDAHWGDYWPLLDEIDALSPLGDAVIVIHDFKAPGTDFGYDSYGGQDLDIGYISPVLDAHFARWKHWYNRVAGGANRGVCFILTGELCE